MGREAQKLTVLGLSEMLVSRPPEGVERPSVWPARALSPSMLPSGHSHSQLCAVRGASAGLETHLPFPASPSLPATRAVLGPRVACSLRPWSGMAWGRGGCAKARGSAAAPASGSLLPARLTWPLAGPAPSVLHLGGAPGSAGTDFGVTRPGLNPSFAI